MRSKAVIFLFALVTTYMIFNRQAYRNNMFQWDASGYYLYLPAIFIYHDLGRLQFYHDLNSKYHMCDTGKEYCIFDEPGRKKNNKYAIGTCFFELPFFLAAHAYCLTTSSHPPDGFSTPYQFAGLISNIFWVCIGLLFVRKLLNKYFDDRITAFVLLCVAFGTNIYCYTTFTPGMSHPFGFFLFALILYVTDALYTTLQAKYFYWLAILLGLVIITRPINIVIAVIPLMWEVHNKESILSRFKFFRSHLRDIFSGVAIVLLLFFVQMWYWKYTTGHWIHYSYIGEGFNFLRPHIIDGLFSYRKGWFLYTPIALVSLLGIFAMWQANRKIVPAIVTFLVLMIYFVFSWRNWWYGGGFSARAMIESLPVIAFPLAYLSRAVYLGTRSPAIKAIFTLGMCFFIALNLFQSYQYKGGIINDSMMSKAYYWRVFGKTEASAEDTKYLMSLEEWNTANAGLAD